MSEQNTQVQGTIKTGTHTSGHGAWLKARGYTVTEGDGKITVTGTSFVEKLDLSGSPEAQVAVMKKVIEAKQLLTYATEATIPGGKTRKSIMLCTFLGAASALVVKPVGAVKAAGENLFASL